MSEETAVRTALPNNVAELAQFFPTATPVRIPVRVQSEGESLSENTVIEFGTPDEVLFASSLPMEFGERIVLQNSDGSLNAQASVVAMQLGNGRVAVAARFTERVPNWIVKA